jgi:hypothetical protein
MMQPTKHYPGGHVLRKDAEHIARVIHAIELRRLDEVELRFSTARNIVQFREVRNG